MRRVGYGILVAYLLATASSRSRQDPAAHGRASPGYVLFSPLLSAVTYLIDARGAVVHLWEGDFAPGASVYLLDNGHLLRPARDPELPFFAGGGQGGRIQELTWEGERVWDCILEIAPRPPSGGRIVWEWHVWDHLIQDHDPARPG